MDNVGGSVPRLPELLESGGSLPPGPDPPGRHRALARLAIAVLLAMSTWFSTSAIVSQLTSVWDLGVATTAWLTIAVQLGFVGGAALSAGLSLTDRVPARIVIAGGTALAASANLALLAASTAGQAIGLRALTGAALAGVYAPAIKSMATWFREGRGLALGTMISALTFGSALPHLVRASGDLDWRTVIVATSLLTFAGGFVALTSRDGPFVFPSADFDPRAALQIVRDPLVRLATYGYLGHMWELYAMWAWIGLFLDASFAADGMPDHRRWAAFATFVVIASGGVGAVVGGRWSDRAGRPRIAAFALALSGASAIAIGPAFGAAPWLVTAIAVVWGVTVVADSALFSAIVTDVAEPRLVGTAVTLQLAAGFTLTVATIWLVPVVVGLVGWSWAFLILLPGPLVGIVAMNRLEQRLARRVPTTHDRNAPAIGSERGRQS